MGIPLGINLEAETPERSGNLSAPELVLEEAACHFPPVQALVYMRTGTSDGALPEFDLSQISLESW